MSQIPVLLVDSDEANREMLSRFILEARNGLAVVGQAGSGSGAVGVAAATKPQVIVLGVQGVEDYGMIARLRGGSPRSDVLILSSREDGEAVYEAVRAGAAGFVPRSAGPAALIEAVHCVADGEIFFHPSAAAAGVLWAARRLGEVQQGRELLARLTTRERTIMGSLARGSRPAAVASQLGVSRRTVEAHLANAYRKLGVHGQAEALRKIGADDGMGPLLDRLESASA